MNLAQLYSAYSGAAGGGAGSSGADGPGGSGGGGGYGSSVSEKISSGGQNRGAFGSVNFGANAKVGGTSAGDGGGTSILLYIVIAGLAVVTLVLFLRR